MSLLGEGVLGGDASHMTAFSDRHLRILIPERFYRES